MGSFWNRRLESGPLNPEHGLGIQGLGCNEVQPTRGAAGRGRRHRPHRVSADVGGKGAGWLQGVGVDNTRLATQLAVPLEPRQGRPRGEPSPHPASLLPSDDGAESFLRGRPGGGAFRIRRWSGYSEGSLRRASVSLPCSEEMNVLKASSSRGSLYSPSAPLSEGETIRQAAS